MTVHKMPPRADTVNVNDLDRLRGGRLLQTPVSDKPLLEAIVQERNLANMVKMADTYADARRWNALVDAIVNAAQDRPVSHDVAAGFLAIIATYPEAALTREIINEAMDTAMVGIDAPDR